ncbi:MAG: hypothetical protein A3F72_10980 [Bacteroidetes bacterium RIFCSPLOWO2_12_FULL_35_15]|nr:MAG: hypothetical protein A3F72_10980 [Bacteroidetes bacterium RIFCSPLOWO2_12_FULL_35_15]
MKTKKTKAKGKKKGKKKLSDQEKEQKREQDQQAREIRTLMTNIGFSRVPGIDGKHFTYDSRESEIDDIFYYENIFVLTEYTIGDPGIHLKEKKIIYDKINLNPANFFKFLLTEDKFKSLKQVFESVTSNKYTANQLQIRILYASKRKVVNEHKVLVTNIHYFDYPVVKYFVSIAKIIKKSTKHEFFDFLGIDFSKIGDNIKQASKSTVDEFSGHILPEEHSSFKEGYKIVSFYIDAESLIKRAYVLRRDGWRNKDNIGFYQRMFVAQKIKSMRKYLHDEKRVFINNIITTLPINEIRILDEGGSELSIDNKGNFTNPGITRVQPATIKISSKANIIGIIDGQHRTYSYHEGDDVYEKSIAGLRGIQNLLITGILYPKDEPEEKRIKFEAKLFLEINSNQSGASPQLKYEIEFMMNPFSTASISKYIISKLNESGPLGGLFEEYWFEKSKLKTTTIISFGLKPLVKFEGVDSLFSFWVKKNKEDLKKKKDDYKLLDEYRAFCVEQIRNIFIGLKANIDNENWKVNRVAGNTILSVTTINGVINCLRILIENKKHGDIELYKSKFADVSNFPFKGYKSSHYRKMGEDLYEKYFK